VPVDDVQRDGPDDVLDGLEEAEALERSNSSSESEISEDSMPASNDPIDMLTVKRLKEILRSQGLKVSGSKRELRERERARSVQNAKRKQEW
jgi:hypothetical protein